MKKLLSSTEDVFVREMILHGRQEAACRTAFPQLLPQYIAEAIAYMMDNPEVRNRIDAGIIYFYKDYVKNVEIPEIKQVTVAERRSLLKKIMTGVRKYPQYVREGDNLHIIMVPPTEAEIQDAQRMDKELEAMERGVVTLGS